MEDEEMLREYSFTGGVRGKHYEAYRRGHTTIVRQPDGTTIILNESVALDTAEEGFRQGWQEALAGETNPISELWRDGDPK